MIGLRNVVHCCLAVMAAVLLSMPGALAQEEKQEEKEAPCSGLHYRQMDFWIGSWEVTWVGQDGTVGKGTNEIKPTLGGCVIEEQFSGGESLPLRGMSVSMYHRQKEEWRQLWVDNTGGYLAFTGGPKGKDFILSLNNPEEAGQYRRMVWTNIKAESFDWHWQQSGDEGKTWEDIWHLRYVRRQD